MYVCDKIENRKFNRIIMRYLSESRGKVTKYFEFLSERDICALDIYKKVKSFRLRDFYIFFSKLMRCKRERNCRSISSKWIFRRFTT